MCGIFGLVGADQRNAGAALESIRNRGPDGLTLTEIDAGVTFGHARLAVIDIAGGLQPMSAAAGRYVITYNGEIYNFPELRRELEALGHTFGTHSDTEVILLGYAQWGAALLPRLDGMFAFAIWDRTERRLFCARDRIGVKPFFYAHGTAAKNGFVFASTLAPFLALPWLDRPLDYEAVRDYLAFETVLAPRSIVKSVAQLPPAHSLTWRQGTEPRLEQYWSIPQPDPAAPAKAEIVEAAHAAIAESVKRQLIADVPLGVFLSGGIDSSLVVHYMAAAGASPIRTFSVRFPDAAIDESGIAQAVASQYATEHTVFDAEELSGETWRDLIDALDQPLADPAYVPLAALSRLTRRAVTVALSGDGGDELFGGYERFLDTEQTFPTRTWQRPLAALIRGGMAPAALTRLTLSGRAMIDYRKVQLGDYPGTRKDVAAYLQPDALQAARREQTLERWHDLIATFGGCADTDALVRADLWTYLSENCLMKTDRASMAFGLEARVPLLGNPVTDLVLRYPAAVHFNGRPKAILHALAERFLPRKVWDRRKQGFSVPLTRYFNGSWREAGDDLVSRCGTLAPWLRAEAVRQLWQRARANRASRRLMYTFLVLLAWLDRNGARISA